MPKSETPVSSPSPAAASGHYASLAIPATCRTLAPSTSKRLPPHARNRRHMPRPHRAAGVLESPLRRPAHHDRRDGRGAAAVAGTGRPGCCGLGLRAAAVRRVPAAFDRLFQRADAGHAVTAAVCGRAACRPVRAQGLPLAGGGAGRALHAAVHAGGGLWHLARPALGGAGTAAHLLPALWCADLADRSDRRDGHPEDRRCAEEPRTRDCR